MILDSSGEPVRTETPTLKPCPFCGGTRMHSEAPTGLSMWYRCQTCSCTGGHSASDAGPKRMQEQWNSRSLEAEVRKKTLEEVLQFLDAHTPTESTVTNPIRLSFKVLRTELLKLTACKDLNEYLSKE